MTYIKFRSSQMIIITGVLAKEPEMRFTPSGKPVTSASVPVEERWVDAEGTEHRVTTWFNISVWEKSAEFFNKWAKKGTIVQITGKTVTDPVTGGPKLWSKQDGTVGASFQIKPDMIILLGNTRTKEEVGETVSPPEQIQVSEVPPEDDIPF